MVLNIDAHLHIPHKEGVERALSVAVMNGLNAIVFTDYDGTEIFDRLSGEIENPTPLDSSSWEIHQTSDSRVLKLDCFTEELSGPPVTLFVGKGQEVPSRQGHILALGINKTIKPRLHYQETLENIFKQGGIAVFAHPYGTFTGGCGPNVILEAWEKYPRFPLALEVNAQYFDGKTNEKAATLAKVLRIPLFYFSDAHCYNGYSQIGTKLQSVIQIPESIPEERIFDGIKEVMKNEPYSIKSRGSYSTIFENASWQWASLMQNGPRKILGTAKSVLQGLIK